MSFNPIQKNNVSYINKDPSLQTIIFANGFGTDTSAWQQITPAFLNEYNVVQFDNVGAGNAQPEAFSPNKYNTLNSYADDLVDIIETLELKKVTMIAHSVSGMISILASLKKPELFEKLILVGASARYLNDDNYNGGFEQSDLDNLYATMATNYYAWVSGFAPAVMANVNHPELAASFAASLGKIRPDIAQSVARVIFQSDHRNILNQVKTDTFIIQTRRDMAVPLDAALFLNNNIANSKIEVIDAEGHLPHMSAPSKVIESVKNYLSS